MRGLCLIVFIAFIVGVVGPVAEAQAQTGAIEGTVVARENGEPVADAIVLVEGTSLVAVANGIGRLRLEDVPAGSVVLVVQAQGFLELRIPGVQVPQGQTLQLIVELEVSPNYMERVQVTATKTRLSIGEVAAQADIVDRATIDSRGDQTLTQAIAHVPGAIIASQLGLFESVLLRGMPRVGNEFTNTLLLIDGVPQTNSGNDARVVALPINDARSIEVVRGPNSALYGRTAIGGAINVLTADPTPEPQVGFEFTGGEFGTAKGIFNASGPLEQWGGYYVSVASERNGGYFENKTTSDFVAGNSALFAKLRFVPDGQSFGTVSVNRVISDNSTPTNEPVVNGRLLHEIDPRFDRLTNSQHPWTELSPGRRPGDAQLHPGVLAPGERRRGVWLPRRPAEVPRRRRLHRRAVRSGRQHPDDVPLQPAGRRGRVLFGGAGRGDPAMGGRRALADPRGLLRAK